MPRCSTRTRPLLDHEFSRNSTLIHQGCCGCQGRMVDVRITVRCTLTRALRAFRRIEERGLTERVMGLDLVEFTTRSTGVTCYVPSAMSSCVLAAFSRIAIKGLCSEELYQRSACSRVGNSSMTSR